MNNYYNSNTTDDKLELLTHVDIQDNVIGPITREECHNQTTIPWHRTVHIYLIDNNENLLLTRRSKSKDTAPGEITISCAGHVRFNELPSDAAKRELVEELKISPSLKYIKKYFIDYKFEKEVVYVYFSKLENINNIVRSEELGGIIVENINEIISKYKQGKIHFPPGTKEIFEHLVEDELLKITNF